MRIYIYSRKSVYTGKGESVENQIEMCREYISAKIPESDKAEIVVYEDEGFSAKNTNRPQFQKMLRDIKLNKPKIKLQKQKNKTKNPFNNFIFVTSYKVYKMGFK